MRKLVRPGSLSGLVACLVLACTAVEAKAACVVTSIEATYPKIVQSGVPAQLQVTLFRDGELVLLSPSKVGNDDPPGIPRAGATSLFVSGDSCGGVLDWQTNLVEANCQRLYRYTP